jgi:hypothetical protein
MHENDLRSLELSHLDSKVDDSDVGEETSAPLNARLADWANISGYTEWKSLSKPAISLGWDWVGALPSGVLEVLPSSLRTNLMLIDEDGSDLGASATGHRLEAWLHGLAWQPIVLTTVGYQPPLAAAPPC